MIIPISNKILDDFQLKNQEYLISKEYYDLPSGLQEYRLYSYLTTFFNNTTILDIGTFQGRSAVSLSHNETNTVITYDIESKWIVDVPNKNDIFKLTSKKNIIFRLKNVMDDLTQTLLENVKIIVIDIDHYETNEREIIDKLFELNYSGIIILDDIVHPQQDMYIAMQRLWNNLPYPKIDFTKYAHGSGTGVILMNTDIQFEFV
jgi:predicted O-methyltransferase YrrM